MSGQAFGKVVTPYSMDLEDFLRKQAEQTLERARKPTDPSLRRQLEELAQACLAELESIDKTKH